MSGASWADENVTDRVADCDPVFVPSFFCLKNQTVEKWGEGNWDQLLGTSATFSSPKASCPPIKNVRDRLVGEKAFVAGLKPGFFILILTDFVVA